MEDKIFKKNDKVNFIQKLRFLLWVNAKGYFWEKGYYCFAIKSLKLKLLKLAGFKRLERLFLCPSHQCNANCPHCYEKYQFKKENNRLDTKTCMRIIDEFKKMGGYFITFCSGEFLLREDALEIIRYCSARKLAIGLTSNGIILDEKKIDELKIAGLTLLAISIDSANPQKHDNSRGSGCWEKAVNALRLAKLKGIKTQIWTYITKSQQDELDGIAKLGEKLKVDLVYVFFTLLSGNLFNKFEENFSLEDREVIRKKYGYKKPLMLEFLEEDWVCRGGGNEHICVMPSGDATFCPAVPYGYGNIYKENLKTLFYKIIKDYKRLADCTKGQCPVNFIKYREKCLAEFLYPKN